jgi:hypothetical protein
MFEKIRSNGTLQLVLGFCFGIVFGFLLQRGGVTRYDVLIGQLLLRDFTVIQVMLTAALTGMVSVYAMYWWGPVELSPKPGSFGSTVLGGLVFGVGFGILGYCPGTVSGAAAQGSLDAMVGGIPGLIIGTRLYAAVFPQLRDTVLNKGSFGDVTIPQLFHTSLLVSLPIAGALMLGALILIEAMG